jgi:hypothetical protein
MAVGIDLQLHISGSFVTRIDLGQTIMFGSGQNIPGEVFIFISVDTSGARLISITSRIDAKRP